MTNFLHQLQAVDDTIQMLPWQTKEEQPNPPIPISQSTYLFFDLHTYVPRLASKEASMRTRVELGGMLHPYLFLSSSVQPATLIKKMGPWLQMTKQGMWSHQLPLTEETISMGWLLYSVPEYDLGELCQQITQTTGVDVALHFRCIHDGLRANTAYSKPRTKAIHMEVDKNTPLSQQACIQKMYASNARNFPLGIKMRLVPEFQSLTNADAYDKALKLQNLQAQFLARTKTHWIRDDGVNQPHTSLPLYTILQAMMVAHWSATKLTQPLFHTISPMATKDRYLVQYLPQ